MTKQEIINAINATIVANGQKGITAESLNNILTEMVNAIPEGGSGGASPIYLVKASNVVMSEDGTSVTVSSTEEDMVHNATLYAECVALMREGKAVDIKCDVTTLYAEMTGIPVSFAQVTPTDIIYAEANEEFGTPTMISLTIMETEFLLLEDGTAEGYLSFNME